MRKLLPVVVLSGCTAFGAGPSGPAIETAIRAVFADNNCTLTALSSAEGEKAFEAALAEKLGVPVAQVADRDGPIFDYGDDLIEGWMRSGEAVVTQDPPTAVLKSCEPAA